MRRQYLPESPAFARFVAIAVAVVLWGVVFAVAYLAAQGMR